MKRLLTAVFLMLVPVLLLTAATAPPQKVAHVCFIIDGQFVSLPLSAPTQANGPLWTSRAIEAVHHRWMFASLGESPAERELHLSQGRRMVQAVLEQQCVYGQLCTVSQGWGSIRIVGCGSACSGAGCCTLRVPSDK